MLVPPEALIQTFATPEVVWSTQGNIVGGRVSVVFGKSSRHNRYCHLGRLPQKTLWRATSP